MKKLFVLIRRHKFFSVMGFMILMELAALPVVYWRYSVRDFPLHAFIDDFIVARSTAGWWIRPPIAENVPQEYIGNIALRAVKWTDMFKADIFLGWRPVPNRIARHAFDTSYYVTNKQGFSIVENFDEHYVVPKPASVYRVVVLGGSTVMGAGVSDPRKALPAKLLLELRRIPELKNKNVEVINAGVAGYDISQEYLYLLTELVQYEPDLVIAYHGWNDFGTSVAFNILGLEKSVFHATEFASLGDRLNQSYTAVGGLIFFAGSVVAAIGDFWSQLAISHIIRSLFNRFGIDLQIRPHTTKRHTLEELTFNSRSAKHFRSMMQAIVGLGKDRGFAVAQMLQPHGWNSPKQYSNFERDYIADSTKDPYGRALMGLANEFYRAIKPMIIEMRESTSKDQSVCIADVSDVFKDISETVYIDTGHLNELGESLVAKRMVNEIIGCGTFGKV